MGGFLNCVKETYRTLKNGEGRLYAKTYLLVIFLAFVICIARFVYDFIKRVTKRKSELCMQTSKIIGRRLIVVSPNATENVAPTREMQT